MTSPSSPPAGGAELAQVIVATGAATVVTLLLLVLGLGHRSGRVLILARIAAFSERVSGLPGWAAFPAALAGGSLLSAVVGLYWDISLHVDDGRDPGPLANPSHYLILAGLFGIFSAGWISMVLPVGRPSPVALRIRRGWHAPLSGVVMVGCASFAMIGFPLDDVSHRLFGQDVTLWGATHLMMLSGAALTLVAILGLLAEARLAARADGAVRRRARLGTPRLRALRLVSACGGLLVGLSIFQGEFDFAIPQFRLLFQPALIAGAAAVALTTSRVLAGRGAALGTVAFFLVIRGGLSLLVGPGLGESVSHFPLFVAEAALVEGLALVLSTARPYRFGAAAGVLCATAGVVAEWGWSHVWMPLPWPAGMLPEAVAVSLPVAVAGGVIGAFVGGALRLRPEIAGTRRGWGAAMAGVLVIAGVFGYLTQTTVPAAGAVVTLTEVRGAPERTVQAVVRFDPPEAVRDPEWLTVLAWQGGAPLRSQHLVRVREGVYRTSSPVPVHGSWKSAIRLQRGRALASIPIHMPADDAIPAAEIAAPARFERRFEADRKLLQRERKEGVSDALVAASSLIVAALSAALLALIGWSLVRISAAAAAVPAPPARAPVAEVVAA